MVFINLAALHRDPKEWATPDNFNLEHFLENRQFKKRESFLPFSPSSLLLPVILGFNWMSPDGPPSVPPSCSGHSPALPGSISHQPYFSSFALPLRVNLFLFLFSSTLGTEIPTLTLAYKEVWTPAIFVEF